MKLRIIILITLFHNVFSQNCDCFTYENASTKIDHALENADYNSAESEAISLINTNLLVCKMQGLNELIRVYIIQQNWQKAEAAIKQQYKLLPIIKCDSIKWIGDYLLNTSIYYYKTSNYTLAVEYCYKAIHLKEELNDINGILKAKQILMQILSYMDRDMEAASIVLQNYSLIINSKDSYDKADHIIWLIKNYEVFYNNSGEEKYLDTMLVLCDKGKEVAHKYNNKDALIENYLMTDIVMYYKGDYHRGLQFLDTALKTVNYKKDGKELARIHLSRAWDYISLGYNKQAINAYDSSLYYFNNYFQPYEISTAYSDGAEIYAMAGDYKTAFTIYQKGMSIKDSVSSVNTSNKIAELEQKYNKEVNERKIKELNQENQIVTEKKNVANLRLKLLIGLVILILLVVIIFIFIIRQRILNQEKQKLEIEQRLNRSRMNPHFFFNALTSLQEIALEPDRNNELSGYLGKYSKIMRQTLESTYNDLTSLEDELDYIEKYLQIQKLRFPNKFKYEINVTEEIDSFETLIPSMILQPFIENSIEHGFHGITYLGELHIDVFKTSDSLKIIILDNGNNQNVVNTHVGYPSRATQIIKDRLRLLNITYRSKAQYTISKGIEGKGYKIEVTLPFISNKK